MMCIFAQLVEAVDSTKIFARLTSRGTQFLVYEMKYASPTENAMILPLPIASPVRDDHLRFIDLSGYKDFFSDLDDGFPNYSKSEDSVASAPSRSMLKVYQVGNYVSSFVPTMADFSRLDPRFQIPNETWQKIPGYENYGFAVFQLASGDLKPHPMAMEFKTSVSETFFPTVHIHDGEVHEFEDFDHTFYLQHAGIDNQVGSYEDPVHEDENTGLIRSEQPARNFMSIAKTAGIVAPHLLVHRSFLSGRAKNQDTFFGFSGAPETLAWNWKTLLPFSPILLGLGGLAWFFGRRNQVKASVE